MTASCYRRLAPLLLVLASAGGSALAQGAPPSAPPPAQNFVCSRLEGQLALINRGGDPGRAEQAKRLEDSVNKQQFELDRAVAQSRRLGCEGMGIFSLFSTPPAQCSPLNAQIQDMRSNLSRMQMELQRIEGGGELEGQRQMVIAALAQNNCGAQYQAAVNQQRGLFGGLFGAPPSPSMPSSPFDGLQSSGYRTLCVRTCDGYYFPISFSTAPARFAEDEQACRRMCPATEVALYSHRNPGEEVAQAVSVTGRFYRDLPTAFRYRQEFNPACSCRRPGQSWAEALGQTKDITIERGDVVVTEGRSKALSQPRIEAQGRPVRQDQRKPGAEAPAPSQAAAPAPAETPEADSGKRSVRTVGPPFVPAR